MKNFRRRTNAFAAAVTFAFAATILLLPLPFTSAKKNDDEKNSVVKIKISQKENSLPQKKTEDAPKEIPLPKKNEPGEQRGKKIPQEKDENFFAKDEEISREENDSFADEEKFFNAEQISPEENSDAPKIKMNDKTFRTLIFPKELSISVSQKNAALIDSSRKVLVRLKILSDGTVLKSGVLFFPSSQIPLPVQEEIRTQIATWIFSPGKEGFGSFEYVLEIE